MYADNFEAAAASGIPDGATDIAIPLSLSWQAASGATAYDPYLWKDGDARPLTPVMESISGVTATLTFPLLPLTTYHWQVVAKNASDRWRERNGTLQQGTSWSGI